MGVNKLPKVVKLAFHDADTDTDFLAMILAVTPTRAIEAIPVSSRTTRRHPREDVGVGVGVVKCELYSTARRPG